MPPGVSLNDLLPPIGAPTQWGFRAIACAYEEVPNCPAGAEFCEDLFSCRLRQPSTVATGDAQGVGTDAGRVNLRLQVPLAGDLDLRQARVTLARLLREVGGAEELGSGPGGEDVSPRTLSVLPGASRNRARFRTPAREVPHILGTLAIHDGQLTVRGEVCLLTTGGLPRNCSAGVTVRPESPQMFGAMHSRMPLPGESSSGP